jgi:hypothetical protein
MNVQGFSLPPHRPLLSHLDPRMVTVNDGFPGAEGPKMTMQGWLTCGVF